MKNFFKVLIGKITKISISITLLGIGAILCFSSGIIITSEIIGKDYQPVEASVESTTSSTVGNNYVDATLTYEFNGKHYQIQSWDIKESSIRDGTVTIYCSSKDPKDVSLVVESEPFIFTIFGIGCASLIGGGVLLFFGIREIKNKHKSEK